MDSVKINSRFKIAEIYAAFKECGESFSDRFMGSQDFWILILINSGKLNIVTQNGIMTGGAGKAVLFKPGEIHYIQKSGEYAEYSVIAFSADGDRLNQMPNTVIEFSSYEKILANNIISQLSLGNTKEIIPESFKNSESAVERFAAAVENLLLTFSEEDRPCEYLDTKDALLFAEAVKLLEKNIAGQISLTALANELDISLSHLKRIFTAYTSVGVHEYFLLLKINRAKQLLCGGTSVTQTAALSGFGNQNYFSAAFKRITGISPKEFSAASLKGEKKALKTAVPKEIKPAKREDIPSYLL